MERVGIVKCPCGHEVCSTYGLNIGTFYQGNGFDKETAERVALSYNLLSHNNMEVLRAIGQGVAETIRKPVQVSTPERAYMLKGVLGCIPSVRETMEKLFGQEGGELEAMDAGMQLAIAASDYLDSVIDNDAIDSVFVYEIHDDDDAIKTLYSELAYAACGGTQSSVEDTAKKLVDKYISTFDFKYWLKE